MNKQKVLIIPGTKAQIPLIQKLKKEGYYVINVNIDSDSPGFEFADESIVSDILDRENILNIARDNKVVKVMSDMCDIAVPVISYVTNKLGLEGIDYNLAGLYTDKFKMREFCKDNNIKHPKYVKCSAEVDIYDFYNKLGKKIIVKPLDANSSRGVHVINKISDIEGVFEKSVMYSKIEKAVICEEYIEGTEFTVDGIAKDDGHISLAISQKKHYSHNPSIACELVFSPNNDKYDYDKLREINDLFVNKSKLNNSLTHAEYKYSNGEFYLIEIAARGGGNFISSHIVPSLSGIDNYNFLINKDYSYILGETQNDINKRYEYISLKFFDFKDKEGIVDNICGLDVFENNSSIIKWDMNISVGDRLTRVENDSQRKGYYIIGASSEEELEFKKSIVEQSVDLVVKNIDELIGIDEYKNSADEYRNEIDKIKSQNIPLIMWGCGDVARNVMKILQSNNITVDGIVVNGEFIGNKEVYDVNINNFEYYCSKYNEFNLIIGHSHYELEDVIKAKYKQIIEVFAISESVDIVPISVTDIKSNINLIDRVYDFLSDLESKKCFIQYIKARLNNDFRIIDANCYKEKFYNDVFEIHDEYYLDVGAYTGDTIEKYLEKTGGKYKHIYAVEASKKSYNQMHDKFAEYENMTFYNKGVGSKICKLYFEGENAATYISDKNKGEEVEVEPLDIMIGDLPVTFMKINFRFGVLEALEGATRILQNQKPNLAINISLDSKLFFEVPMLIKVINPKYKIYIRFEAKQLSRCIMYAK